MICNITVFRSLNKVYLYIKEIHYYLKVSDSFLKFKKLGCHQVDADSILLWISENHPKKHKELTYLFKYRLVKQYRPMQNINEIEGGEFILCLHPSNRCNLACKYCFRNQDDYYSMPVLTYETAKRAIEFMINIYAPNATKYLVDLSGSGEPLLNFSLIKRIASFCDEMQNEIGKSIAVMFATNAVDLSQDKIDYIRHNLLIGISLDGDQKTNDQNRVDKNHEGTHNKVVTFLNASAGSEFGIATTITPKNQKVDEIYTYLSSLPNINAISMRFVRMYDGSECDFERFDITALMFHYNLLCKNIILELKNKNYDYLKKILRGNDFFGRYIFKAFLNGYLNYFRCDAGKNRIAIDEKADIYICSVLQKYKEYKIGSIYTGLDKNDIKKYYQPNIFQSETCKNCWASYLCGGECYAVSHLKMHCFYKPYDKMCEIKKGLIKLSISLVSTIENECPAAYDEFLNFASEVWQYHTTDSAIWVSIYFLKYHGVIPSYKEVSRYYKLEKYGVAPSAVLIFLRRFRKTIKAYKIKSVDDYSVVKTPAISIKNKKQVNSYQYIIIKEVTNRSIVVNDIYSHEPYEIDKQDFLSSYSDLVIF